MRATSRPLEAGDSAPPGLVLEDHGSSLHVLDQEQLAGGGYQIPYIRSFDAAALEDHVKLPVVSEAYRPRLTYDVPLTGSRRILLLLRHFDSPRRPFMPHDRKIIESDQGAAEDIRPAAP